jgi:hypothetical protein
MQWRDFLRGYAIAAPNALRTFCLHFVSSNMHYYGDVEKGQHCAAVPDLDDAMGYPSASVLLSTLPALTHFHHFVVRDPFYIRQWLAPEPVSADA